MRNLLPGKGKHNKRFAESLSRQMRQMRYGVGSCSTQIDDELASIRKELVDWQVNDDGGALSQVQLRYQTWLAVEYDNVLLSKGGTGYVMSNCAVTPQTLSLNYAYPGSQGGQNVIEVNTGGCITRINLNPAITINQNSSYRHIQSVAALDWDVVHNLGFRPNVFLEDENGIDLDGTVEYVDDNHLKIHFNQPFAGKAYLS